MAKEYSRKDAQISRIDGKNCFVEAVNTCFNIHKVLLNFVKYDENTNKTLSKMEQFLDFDDALGLCEYVLTGSFRRNVMEAGRTGMFEGKPVNDYTCFYHRFSGKEYSSAHNQKKYNELKSSFPRLTDLGGRVIVSKQLKLQASKKYFLTLRIEYGNGEVQGTGAVAPKGNPFDWINIAMDEPMALGFFSAIKVSIQAYYSQFYARNSEVLFKGDKATVFEAIPGYNNAQASGRSARPAAGPAQAAQTENKQPGTDAPSFIGMIAFNSLPKEVQEGTYVAQIVIDDKREDTLYFKGISEETYAEISNAYERGEAIKVRYAVVKKAEKHFVCFISLV